MVQTISEILIGRPSKSDTNFSISEISNRFNSLIIVCCSSIIVIAIDLILYKKEIKEVIYVFKKIFVRRPTMNSQ